MNLQKPLPAGVPSMDEPIEVFAEKLGRTITIAYSSASDPLFLRKNRIRVTDERMPNRVAGVDDEMKELRARLRELEMEKAATQGFKKPINEVSIDDEDTFVDEVVEVITETEEKENTADEQWRLLTPQNRKSYAKGLGLEFPNNASDKKVIQLIETYHKTN